MQRLLTDYPLRNISVITIMWEMNKQSNCQQYETTYFPLTINHITQSSAATTLIFI